MSWPVSAVTGPNPAMSPGEWPWPSQEASGRVKFTDPRNVTGPPSPPAPAGGAGVAAPGPPVAGQGTPAGEIRPPAPPLLVPGWLVPGSGGVLAAGPAPPVAGARPPGPLPLALAPLLVPGGRKVAGSAPVSRLRNTAARSCGRVAVTPAAFSCRAAASTR